MELLKDGIIKSTGRSFTFENENGEKITVNEPEPMHTFAKWKELGRQVKKGEHAKTSVLIWKSGKGKQTDDENPEADGEKTNVKMFMKKAFFFTLEQTEPIKKAE
ncbi:MAG: ArdC family protein [Acetatifactor sp.]|nr:ArdC family protein [Acetatifactor sp.]